MIETNLSITCFRIFSLAFISRRVHSLELGMCKTQLELQDENENVKDMESYKIFTFLEWEASPLLTLRLTLTVKCS